MVTQHQDYRGYLKWVLADRIARNPSYSLRSFARQLGLHHSMVVQLFQNKKRLSVERAHQVAHRLELAGKDYEYFCLLVEIDNARGMEQKQALLARMHDAFPQARVRDLGVEHFQMISEWYHLPLLQMLCVPGRAFDLATAARRLGITRLEAELAVERMERLELIEKDERGEYRKTDSRLLTQSATPHEALRNYHRQMLQKAIESLETQSPREKWIGSETFAFDPSLLPEANGIIEQFLDRMVQLSSRGENRDHVYHLSTCLFRLTNSRTEKP